MCVCVHHRYSFSPACAFTSAVSAKIYVSSLFESNPWILMVKLLKILMKMFRFCLNCMLICYGTYDVAFYFGLKPQFKKIKVNYKFCMKWPDFATFYVLYYVNLDFYYFFKCDGESEKYYERTDISHATLRCPICGDGFISFESRNLFMITRLF